MVRAVDGWLHLRKATGRLPVRMRREDGSGTNRNPQPMLESQGVADQISRLIEAGSVRAPTPIQTGDRGHHLSYFPDPFYYHALPSGLAEHAAGARPTPRLS